MVLALLFYFMPTGEDREARNLIIMKYIVVLFKVLLLPILWVIAVIILDGTKKDFIASNAPVELSSVLWMAFPMVLIVGGAFFNKLSIMKMPIFNHFILQLKEKFEVVIIGKLILFLLFTVLAFTAAYFIMMGIHFMTLTNIPIKFIVFGLGLFIFGIFIWLISNLYFRS